MKANVKNMIFVLNANPINLSFYEGRSFNMINKSSHQESKESLMKMEIQGKANMQPRL